MALRNFEKEVRHFLRAKGAGVLCISGKWGVGKTYGWQKYLKDAVQDETKKPGEIATQSYSYVSLFGVTSLADVKRAIFENTVKNQLATQPADTSKNLADWIGSWRKLQGGTGLLKVLPFQGADAVAGLAADLGFATVRNQLICFDDLERKSKAFDMQDLLGLISFLKEQRKCKVVVLLNEDKLDNDEDRKVFTNQLEKVVDAKLVFEPTALEAATIGVNPEGAHAERLRELSVKLDITNIRTIKRIEVMAYRITEEMGGYEKRIVEQLLHSVALFAFLKLEPDAKRPPLDYVKTYNAFTGALPKAGEEKTEWRSFLHLYNFHSVDNLDLVVLDGVQAGSFDFDQMKVEADKQVKAFARRDADADFDAAWKLYHESFDANAEDFMEGLANSIRKNAPAISVPNLSRSIAILKELGWTGDCQELLAAFVAQMEDMERDYWDLSQNSFREEIDDPEVIATFEAKLATFPPKYDFEKTLIALGRDKGYSPGEAKFLSEHTPDQFYEAFKSLRGDDHYYAVKGSVVWSQNTQDANMRSAIRSASEALRRIAAESQINARRVKQITGQDFAPKAPAVEEPEEEGVEVPEPPVVAARPIRPKPVPKRERQRITRPKPKAD